MHEVEQEKHFLKPIRVISNRIEVQPVEGPSLCREATLVMALNALTKTSIRVTVEDVRQVGGNFNEIIDGVGERYGLNDVVIRGFLDPGLCEQLSEQQEFDLYRSLIDAKGLIFGFVQGALWVKLLGYGRPVENLGHMILINGYRAVEIPWLRTSCKRSLLCRDHNIPGQLVVPYSAYYRARLIFLDGHDFIFAHHKDNQEIGRIQVPIKEVPS